MALLGRAPEDRLQLLPLIIDDLTAIELGRGVPG